jgi:hypothetical protein
MSSEASLSSLDLGRDGDNQTAKVLSRIDRNTKLNVFCWTIGTERSRLDGKKTAKDHAAEISDRIGTLSERCTRTGSANKGYSCTHNDALMETSVYTAYMADKNTKLQQPNHTVIMEIYNIMEDLKDDHDNRVHTLEPSRKTGETGKISFPYRSTKRVETSGGDDDVEPTRVTDPSAQAGRSLGGVLANMAMSLQTVKAWATTQGYSIYNLRRLSRKWPLLEKDIQ